MSGRTLAAARPPLPIADQFDDILRELDINLNTPSAAYYGSLPPPRRESLWENQIPVASRPSPPSDDLLLEFDPFPTTSTRSAAGVDDADFSPGRYFDEGNLVDIDDPPPPKLKPAQKREPPTVMLLCNPVYGLHLEKEGDRWVRRHVQVDSGAIMRRLDDEPSNKWIADMLNEWCAERDGPNHNLANSACLGDILDPTLCAVVANADVMRIDHHQAMILLAVPRKYRVGLYQDFERFTFIQGLAVGSEVLVDADEKMPYQAAEISWVGNRERDREDGVWFGVNFVDANPRRPNSNPFASLDFDTRSSRHAVPQTTPWASSNGGFGGDGFAMPADSRRLGATATAPRLFYTAHQLHQPTAGAPNKGVGSDVNYDSRRAVKASTQHLDDYRRPSNSNSNGRHPTTTTTANLSDERVIPTRRVGLDDDASSSSSSSQRNNSLRSSNGRLGSSTAAARAQPPPPPSVYPQSSLRSEYRSGLPTSQSHQRLSQPVPATATSTSTTTSVESRTPPSRSKSVHSLARRSTTNEHVSDERTNGARIGDECIWRVEDRDERGRIRFLGLLKNHSAVYAGVEFDNPIGAGTGTFEGEQLFYAPANHAGFVELGALEILRPSMRRRPSMSRIAAANAAATATSTTMAPPHQRRQQASADSLTDAPPPYSPPTPPTVPPRATTMAIDDYLIDAFVVGGNVVVSHLGAQITGIVRWLGDAMSEDGDRLQRSAIVELDVDVPQAWRPARELGGNVPAANTPRGALVPTSALRHGYSMDPRRKHGGPQIPPMPPVDYIARNGVPSYHRRADEFGSVDSGVEKTRCAPTRDVSAMVGRQRGIQGHCNSCYLDATLYAMFAQNTFFDFLLERPPRKDDHKLLATFQKVLATEIVYPLRKSHYVRADHTMKLRTLLADMLPGMGGLTSQEKDPEEILSQLFANIFRVEPFIKLINAANGKTDTQYLCPMVVDDWQGGAATTQHLLERHMRAAQLSFATPPEMLILQLPRYGQQKVFDKILPLETIDITPLVHEAVVACSGCRAAATVHCPTCFLIQRVFFAEVCYCDSCFWKAHGDPERGDHCASPLPKAYRGSHRRPSPHLMSLSAVLCIETSHYVAFVRTASDRWLFLDSFSDREGFSDGFNVPVVIECDNMWNYLSAGAWEKMKEADEAGQVKAMFGKGAIDPLVGRMLSDSYICFYEMTPTTPTSSSSVPSSSTASHVLSKFFKSNKD